MKDIKEDTINEKTPWIGRINIGKNSTIQVISDLMKSLKYKWYFFISKISKIHRDPQKFLKNESSL